MSPAGEPIPLAQPDVGPREEELVLEVLRSGMLSLGPMGPRFERAFADWVGTKHAAAVSSGTAGLHLGLVRAGVGPGDEVITSPFSFISSANCALHAGADVAFADIDPVTFNLDPAALEAAITPRTKAIVPVHIFGLPCDIEAISAIAAKHGLAIVEDGAEALGAVRQGRKVGTHGSPTIFAFYPNKQMTTGEGGIVTTDDDDVYEDILSLRNQGRADSGAWLEHDRLGWNYRMDDLSAAVGLAQVERLDEILGKRAAVADRYATLLAGVPGVTLPSVVEGEVRSWFFYTLLLEPGVDRNAVIGLLAERGVASKPYLPSIHLQPLYRARGHREGEFPVSEEISSRALALPFFGNLTLEQQERVAAELVAVLSDPPVV
ncbi:MAG: DegT/DnrJ/EryC1/StrS family aminotransferase [Gaiellales bacterium]